MARVTARNAFAKTRAKRRNGGPTPGIRQRYVINLPLFNTDSNSQQSSISSTSRNQDSVQPGSSKKRAQAIKTPNWKITDYFAVLSKGRENVPKSPQSLARAQRATNRLRQSLKSKCAPEVDALLITISDSEDDNPDHDKPLIASDDRKIVEIKSDIKTETDPIKTEPCNIDFNEIPDDSNEDIEIITTLPPISLRDHPVLELED